MTPYKQNDVRSNFIRTHLIKEIFIMTNLKKKICGVDPNSFIYFDSPIQTTTYKIDRFGKGNFHFKDQMLPISWTSVNGDVLLKALNEVKNNKVFVYREIDGKYCKTRVKNKNA